MVPHVTTHLRSLPVKATMGFLVLCLIPVSGPAQTAWTRTNGPQISDADLDPARNIASPQLESGMHQPLSEQYIWTREDAVPEKPNINGSWTSEGNTHLEPHYFRRSFAVGMVPRAATMYVAGPGTATVYLNGERVAHFQSSMEVNIGARVLAIDVTHALKPGTNLVAIEAIRGPEVGSSGNSRREVQLTAGRVLAVKIVPTAQGINATPLVISDTEWKTAEKPASGWQSPAFDDGSWETADSLGGIESSMDFYQWN